MPLDLDQAANAMNRFRLRFRYFSLVIGAVILVCVWSGKSLIAYDMNYGSGAKTHFATIIKKKYTTDRGRFFELEKQSYVGNTKITTGPIREKIFAKYNIGDTYMYKRW